MFSYKSVRKETFSSLLFQSDPNIATHFDHATELAQKLMLQQTCAPKTNESKLLSNFEWEDLIHQIETFRHQIIKISTFAPQYDSETKVQGNGYRTFVALGLTAIRNLTKILLDIQASVTANDSQAKELGVWLQGIKDLSLLNSFLLEIHDVSNGGNLFPPEPEIEDVEILARRIAYTDLSRFYGKLAAFYLKGDAQGVVKQVAQCIALYANIYSGTYSMMGVKLVTNLVNLAQFLYDEDKIVKSLGFLIREVPVDFCKSYFNLPESLLVGKIISRNDLKVESTTLITIEPEPLETMSRKGKTIKIQIPSSHLGLRPLNARLISPFRTEKMKGSCRCLFRCICSCIFTPPTSTIFFHMHGGGFVAQTSKSHETYLNQWALEWNIPILSIDYSLAPEAPYPRALEEVVYAYAWMRENFLKLGTTGKKVIVGGDSAGGNLSVALFHRCIELDLPRPDGLFLFYPSLLCEMYPSPSRLICLIDPMVMFPMLMRCVNAYTEQNYKGTCPRTFSDEVDACQSPKDPLLSPILTPDNICAQFPPTHLFTTDVDPCLDETITFSNKLIRNGAKGVTLDILGGLPHGFLSLNGFSRDCGTAVDLLTAKLKSLLP